MPLIAGATFNHIFLNISPPYKFGFEYKDDIFKHLKTVTAPSSHILA